jgi:hypothetical protein
MRAPPRPPAPLWPRRPPPRPPPEAPLARFGDPSAAPTVYAALGSDNPVLRSIAAKQLLLLADAGEPAARKRIEKLQADADDGLAAIARVQLADL